MYTTMANTLRELGYAVIVPDYRKYPEVKAGKMYHDVRKTIRWAFTHAHEFSGDTEQIHVMVSVECHAKNRASVAPLMYQNHIRDIVLELIWLRKLYY